LIIKDIIDFSAIQEWVLPEFSPGACRLQEPVGLGVRKLPSAKPYLH
jgi:hypothetical protein